MRAQLAMALAVIHGLVSTALAESIPEPLELEGLLQPKVTVVVSAPIEGVVEKVFVDRGDLVKRGQTLATLDARVEKAAVEVARLRAEAEAAFERNNTRIRFADLTLDRSAALERKGVVAQSERDEAEAERALALAELVEAQEARDMGRAELARAKAVVALRTVRSPIDGVVVNRLLSPGDLADPAQILELAQIDPLNVEVFAPLSAWGRIEPGMAAEVRPEPPARGVYHATVTVIDRVIDAASGTFRIRLELPNPDHALPAGLKCDVRFTGRGNDKDSTKGGE